jgi:NADPH2:quinone reductase
MSAKIPSKMAGIIAKKAGKPSVLEYSRTLPVPLPGPGELLVRLSAIGVNMIDTYRRSGLYPAKYPHIPGSEGSGVVVGHGEGERLREDFPLGTRVAFLTGGFGAYAQYAAVPAATTFCLPDSLSDSLGASLLLQGLTAHYLVNDCGRVRKGDAVLVHAGAGGTGRLLLGLCRAAGATTIITTTSSAEKEEIAREAGATSIIRYDTCDDVAAEVRERTGGEGVRVVFDGVGKATFASSLHSLSPRGTLVLFGNASGPVPPFDPLDLTRAGSITLCRPRLQEFIATPQEFQTRATSLVSSLSLSPSPSPPSSPPSSLSLSPKVELLIGLSLSLFDAQLAHERLSERRTVGKVILLPQEGVDPGTPIPDRRERRRERERERESESDAD